MTARDSPPRTNRTQAANDPSKRVVDRLADPSVHRVPTGHFDVHVDPWFEPVVEEQVAFLGEALAVDPENDERRRGHGAPPQAQFDPGEVGR